MKTIVKSEYDIQAEGFLNKTGAKMEFIYTGHRPHFQDDKEFRSTWLVTIIKDNKHMTLDFGQSMADSWKLIDNRGGGMSRQKTLPMGNKYWTAKSVKEAMSRGQEVISMNGALLLYKVKTKPSEYDVLACLAKCDPETFEDFCSNYGYDTDSMKANETYKAVMKEYKDLSRLFNEQELEEMSEIN